MNKTETVTHLICNQELIWYPNSHRAKVNNEWLDSVTSITGIIDKSAALLYWSEDLTNSYAAQWLADCPNDSCDKAVIAALVSEAAKQYLVEKEKAADIGDKVHDYALDFAKARIAGEPLPKIDSSLPQEAINGINAFIEWNKAHKVDFHEAERLVYSPDLNYFGWIDAVATVDGKLTLIDYKTGKKVYAEAYAQVAGYWRAWQDETQRQFDQGYILHFDKQTGAFEAKHQKLITPTENGTNLTLFLNCLAVKKLKKEIEKKLHESEK